VRWRGDQDFVLAEGTTVHLCAGHLADWEKQRARVSRLRGPIDDLANYEIWLTAAVRGGSSTPVRRSPR